MENIVKFIRDCFDTSEFIPLHEPRFIGNEKQYLNECIDSTFVSSTGEFVNLFEKKFAQLVGSKFAIATSNGTSALHIALILAGVERDDEIITQPLTFVATCNAASYIGAKPVFVDVDLDTMGLSPASLKEFLTTQCEVKNKQCYNKTSGKIIKACVPMHTFGNPARIDEIVRICKQWYIVVVEDSAESLGSYYQDKHTGTFGKLGIFSFNGNKIVTSGGGGAIVTDCEATAMRAKHLTTTAKKPHRWEYIHDEVGFNYRMPNLNAALLVAQLESLEFFCRKKRELALKYKQFFEKNHEYEFVTEPQGARSNYWLNALKLESAESRDAFLEYMNKNGIMTRPVWKLMNELPMYKGLQSYQLINSKHLEQIVVNIPSSVIL